MYLKISVQIQEKCEAEKLRRRTANTVHFELSMLRRAKRYLNN
jgi:hypothetical protein